MPIQSKIKEFKTVAEILDSFEKDTCLAFWKWSKDYMDIDPDECESTTTQDALIVLEYLLPQIAQTPHLIGVEDCNDGIIRLHTEVKLHNGSNRMLVVGFGEDEQGRPTVITRDQDYEYEEWWCRDLRVFVDSWEELYEDACDGGTDIDEFKERARAIAKREAEE